MLFRMAHLSMDLTMTWVTKPDNIKWFGVILMMPICSSFESARLAWATLKMTMINSIVNSLTCSKDQTIVFFKAHLFPVFIHVFPSMRSNIILSMVRTNFLFVFKEIFMAINTGFCFHTFPATSTVVAKFCSWFIDETGFADHVSDYTHLREVTQ